MTEFDAKNETTLPSVTADASKPETEKKRFWFWRFPKSWAEVKRLGWKFIVAFILFYLIRDIILYIVIPYFIYKGIIKH